MNMLRPEEALPLGFVRIMQDMWASNGDAISQIYAGTEALKVCLILFFFFESI